MFSCYFRNLQATQLLETSNFDTFAGVFLLTFNVLHYENHIFILSANTGLRYHGQHIGSQWLGSWTSAGLVLIFLISK